MDIFIYSDESGVFDKVHNNYFVYAGVICFGKENKEIECRKYSNVEKHIRKSKYNGDKSIELKASTLSNSDKGKIYRSLNNSYKFAIIIDENKIHNKIYENKKSKQRYLDYAFKIGLKKCFEYLIANNKIKADEIDNMYFFADEHSTATNGRYELRESLINEFKYGTFNYTWDKYFEPIIPKLKSLDLKFCDSKAFTLIRAADIIANRIFFLKTNSKEIKANENLFVIYLPISWFI